MAVAAAGLAISVAGYGADVAAHANGLVLNWFDLRVYAQAGLLARHDPASLYSWQLTPLVRFTYPPFAALIFAVASVLPALMLHWLMTAASGAALAVTVGLTFTALGWRGRDRLAATLALTALTLWTEPVLRALELGQIELLLMTLIVWDLGQPDRRHGKGLGIGLAAGIKLVPLIFIPYLLLSGRLRQAVAAAAAFAASVAIGFVLLPQASVTWWLTGYFLRASKVGGVSALVNQSLLAMIARAVGGPVQATPLWLACSAFVAVAGLAAAALLHRAGHQVPGWIACALTGLLVSPVSWDHHWVWIVPVLVLLTDQGARAGRRASGLRARQRLQAGPELRSGRRFRPRWGGLAGRKVRSGWAWRARWGYLAALAAVAGVFGGWPASWTGRHALVPRGLLGFFVGAHTEYQTFHLHGFQVVGWNLFVLSGLLMLAAAVATAARLAWPRRRHGPGPPPSGPGVTAGLAGRSGRAADDNSYPGTH